jgi:hypothetical protein
MRGLDPSGRISERVAITTRGLVRAHLRLLSETRADTQVRSYRKITACLGLDTAQKVNSFVMLRERSDRESHNCEKL